MDQLMTSIQRATVSVNDEVLNPTVGCTHEWQGMCRYQAPKTRVAIQRVPGTVANESCPDAAAAPPPNPQFAHGHRRPRSRKTGEEPLNNVPWGGWSAGRAAPYLPG
eukprot:62119-Pleurochrysis_carterae.AAC.7